MYSNYTNLIESSVKYAKVKTPQLILNFLDSMREFAVEPFRDFIGKCFNSKDLYIFFKHHKIFQNGAKNFQRMAKDFNLRFLSAVNPLFVLNLYANDENQIVQNFFRKIYEKESFLNKDFYNEIKDLINWEQYHQSDFTLDDRKTPILTAISLSEMASINLDEEVLEYSESIEYKIPKVGIVTAYNYDIDKFTNISNNAIKESNWRASDILSSSGSINYKVEDKLSLENVISEEVIAQIDYVSLFQGLLGVYKEAFWKSIGELVDKLSKEKMTEFLNNLLLKLDLTDNIHEFASIDWETENSYSRIFGEPRSSEENIVYKYICDHVYFPFVALEFLFQANKDFYNGENFENEYESTIILKSFKENFDTILDEYLLRCSASVIFTFLAKIGRSYGYTKYDIHKEILLNLLEITMEDISYTNELFTHSENRFKDIANQLEKLNFKKSAGKVIRKRLFDYITVMQISQNDVKYSPYSPIKNPAKNAMSNYKMQQEFTVSNHIKGSLLYKLTLKSLQEIYSQMTYTTNFEQNIIGIRGDKYIYKDTLELAKIAMDQYIKDPVLKLDLVTYFDKKLLNEKTLVNEIFLKINSISSNSMVNHRALASLYKLSLHQLFKLMDHLNGMKETAKFNQLEITDIPSEWFDKYEVLRSNINEIYRKFEAFFHPSRVKNFLDLEKDARGTYCSDIDSMFPSYEFAIGRFVSSKWTHGSPLADINSNISSSDIKFYILLNTVFFNAFRDSEKYKEMKNSFKIPFTVDLRTIIENMADAFDESAHRDISKKEFNENNAILDIICNFANRENPEVIALNDGLIKTHENLELFKAETLGVHPYETDVTDLVNKSLQYIENTKPEQVSLEALSIMASLVTGCEMTLNKKTDNHERIKEYTRAIEKFDEALVNFVTKRVE